MSSDNDITKIIPLPLSFFFNSLESDIIELISSRLKSNIIRLPFFKISGMIVITALDENNLELVAAAGKNNNFTTVLQLSSVITNELYHHDRKHSIESSISSRQSLIEDKSSLCSNSDLLEIDASKYFPLMTELEPNNNNNCHHSVKTSSSPSPIDCDEIITMKYECDNSSSPVITHDAANNIDDDDDVNNLKTSPGDIPMNDSNKKYNNNDDVSNTFEDIPLTSDTTQHSELSSIDMINSAINTVYEALDPCDISPMKPVTESLTNFSSNSSQEILSKEEEEKKPSRHTSSSYDNKFSPTQQKNDSSSKDEHTICSCQTHTSSSGVDKKLQFFCRFCDDKNTFKSDDDKSKVPPSSTNKKPNTGEKNFSCNFCSKSFMYLSHLATHKRSHTGEKPFVCEICSRSFSRTSNLNVHQKACHMNQKPFPCGICSKSFMRSDHLLIHKRRHSGEKPFCCKKCHKTYVSSNGLRIHSKKHCVGEKESKIHE